MGEWWGTGREGGGEGYVITEDVVALVSQRCYAADIFVIYR